MAIRMSVPLWAWAAICGLLLVVGLFEIAFRKYAKLQVPTIKFDPPRIIAESPRPKPSNIVTGTMMLQKDAPSQAPTGPDDVFDVTFPSGESATMSGKTVEWCRTWLEKNHPGETLQVKPFQGEALKTATKGKPLLPIKDAPSGFTFGERPLALPSDATTGHAHHNAPLAEFMLAHIDLIRERNKIALIIIDAMKNRAKHPVMNIASLDPVPVGSLGDTWPYLVHAALDALGERGFTIVNSACNPAVSPDTGPRKTEDRS